MKRIAVLCSGGGTNLQAIIDGVVAGEINGEIVCMIYNRKNAYAKVRATSASIPAVYINKLQFKTEKDMMDAIHNTLLSYDVDIIVLAGYLAKIGINTVKHFKNNIINTHPALIPSFCGKGFHGENVHKAALKYGVKISGCTIHFIDENYDTGPIIMQKSVPVLKGDTPASLAKRILPIEHELLANTVKLLCDDRITVLGRQVIIK